MTTLCDIARNAKAWPFEEARKLVERFQAKPPKKGFVLFETGYGPSGLPHIGTFGEVLRTSLVRHAFKNLSDLPTRLFAFSDDMDGLRKVPDNVPNPDLLRQFIGRPLTEVPDPFGAYESFGAHNNARLCAFLDRFGFEYEFQSATDSYRSGRFDATLLKVLALYDAVSAVILPSLRAERQATYSPFLPICPTSGIVLQTPIVQRDVEAGTVTYRDERTGRLVETPVTGGHCKLQWKVDWAMRWVALDVDYEMAGKDLISSVELSSKVATILGAKPPEGFNYELFLDQHGQKISKSKGNGLSMEEWLRYAPPESLAFYMFQQPRRAKRLYFDVIPKAVDEYLTSLSKFAAQTLEQQLENPVWHLHFAQPCVENAPVSFALLLNLASVAHVEEEAVLWGFIERYRPGLTKDSCPLLAKLVPYALTYYRDFVRPAKSYRAPTPVESEALADLAKTLSALPASSDAESLQNTVYEVGKRHSFPELRDWFKAIYETLLGQEQGPRMGSFIALYGKDETVALIGKALDGALAA